MVRQELLDWIQNERNQGYSEDQIKNALSQQGYTPDQINEAFGSQEPSAGVPKSLPKKSFNPWLIVVGLVLIALLGGGYFFLTDTFGSTQEVTPPTNEPENEELEEEIPVPEPEDTGAVEEETEEPTSDVECEALPDNLDSCSEYTCTFTHPFSGEQMQKEILGIVEGTCNYVEEMPNNGKMECSYSESMRKAIAQYYRDLAAAESAGTEVTTDTSTGEVKTTYTIDGKEVENPLQEAMTSGVCVISGY